MIPAALAALQRLRDDPAARDPFEVLALTPEKPLFGQQTGRGMKTHWLVFMKP